MKPSRREREALSRKPVSPLDHQYEMAKRRWAAEHPEATPAEYEAAIRRIAKALGI